VNPINSLAVLACGPLHMAIGMAWYGALAKPWLALIGKPEAELKKKSPAPGYLISLAGAWLAAWVLAHFLVFTQSQGVLDGMATALWIWTGFVVPATLPDYFFADRPKGLWLINAGYPLVSLVAMGALLAAWK
jgi:hypothetical protein